MNNSELIERLYNYLKKHGHEALERARKSVLNETFDCEVVKGALHYFIVEYWCDFTTPTLLFLACEAVGGDSKRLVNLASGIILINGGIDIHDDVVDRTRRKDGRSTVYGRFGKEVALLTGDALLMKGFIRLAETCQIFGTEKTKETFSLLKQGLFELGEAEVLELEFRHRFDVKPEEYLKVMYRKSADIEALMRVGAFLGDASAKEIEILGRYGRIVGLLSILRDDSIDMTLREELRHRIRYECLPLPLLYALHDSEMNVKIVELLQKKKKTRNDLEEIRNLTQKADGFEKTQQFIRNHVEEGKVLINKLGRKQQELRLILDSLTISDACDEKLNPREI